MRLKGKQVIEMGSAAMATTALFGITSLAVAEPPLFPEWLQYGAFGLCCVLVIYLMRSMNKLGEVIRDKDREYVNLMRDNITYQKQLAQLLGDRPCINRDHRAEN